MIHHLLDKACVIVLVYCLLETVEDLANIKRIEDDKWEVFNIFLHLIVGIIASLQDRLF